MLRSSVGWCFAILLVVGGLNACGNSSGDEATGKGGTGTVIGGSGGSGGTDATAGTRTGGTAGTSTGGGCADVPLTCVDATMASGCNSETNMVDTFSCVDDLAALGVTSKGCTKDALSGDHCDVSGFKDEGCRAGALAYATCQGSTSEERFNVYVNCYTNYMMIHDTVTCLGEKLTGVTAAACQSAFDTCVNGTGGDGAGGAPPEPMGGASAGGAGGAG